VCAKVFWCWCGFGLRPDRKWSRLLTTQSGPTLASIYTDRRSWPSASRRSATFTYPAVFLPSGRVLFTKRIKLFASSVFCVLTHKHAAATAIVVCCSAPQPRASEFVNLCHSISEAGCQPLLLPANTLIMHVSVGDKPGVSGAHISPRNGRDVARRMAN